MSALTGVGAPTNTPPSSNIEMAATKKDSPRGKTSAGHSVTDQTDQRRVSISIAAPPSTSSLSLVGAEPSSNSAAPTERKTQATNENSEIQTECCCRQCSLYDCCTHCVVWSCAIGTVAYLAWATWATITNKI